uniref:Uncharacterized protein n=1 Tax=Rhipicephalus microplus TaxID=6941 RepID=A0A6G5AGI9_RHIMP
MHSVDVLSWMFFIRICLISHNFISDSIAWRATLIIFKRQPHCASTHIETPFFFGILQAKKAQAGGAQTQPQDLYMSDTASLKYICVRGERAEEKHQNKESTRSVHE